MKRSVFGLIAAIITANMLWASEEAYDGAGLHWVVLWGMVGLLASLNQFSRMRSDEQPAGGPANKTFRTAQLADIGWMLIAVGQWISTARLFRTGGDRRTALNLSLEWFALAIAWWVFRQLQRHHDQRRQLGILFACLIAGIATYGLWQHHVIYVQQSDWYTGIRNELDELAGSDNPASFGQIAKLKSELQQNGIPLSGTDRILWENRLLNSTEPTGTFALANTLAGLLGVGLVMIAGQLANEWMKNVHRRKLQMLYLCIVFTLAGYCFVLTKSRTAWIATLVGFVILFAQRRRTPASTRRAFRIAVFAGATMLLTSAIAAATGALDKEVLLESPRSLQFRLLYWLGTRDVLLESPVFGAGPGNFRQAYLRHKPPESSEEIRDPHNMLLEAWTSGGLMSLVGIILCSTAWGISFRHSRSSDREQNERLNKRVTDSEVTESADAFNIEGALWKACVTGFLLHSVWQWLNGRDFSDAIDPFLLVPFTSVAGCWILTRSIRPRRSPQKEGQQGRNESEFEPMSNRICLAASAVLGIHLLGAGGFQMPSVMLVFAAMLTGATGSDPVLPPAQNNAAEKSNLSTRLAATTNLVLCTIGLFVSIRFGLMPVRESEQFSQQAQFALIDGNTSTAVAFFKKAASADPFGVHPRQQIAELETYRLQEMVRQQVQGHSASVPPDERREINPALTRQFKLALRACENLENADLQSVVVPRLRSGCEYAMFEGTGDRSHLGKAVEHLQEVVRMYPTNPVDLWRLAITAADDSQRLPLAKNAAAKAVLQDEINHKWGHIDRYLSEDQLAQLESILNQ
ncbi:MAG: O-antigen ligase family protein [Planctomycetaceae bacterium]|nr:O-antigen ligase family protein [Planctomycetaceae bacterium]